MNSFYHLHPDPFTLGLFLTEPAPQAGNGPGLIVYPDGSGQFWLQKNDLFDPKLHFTLPGLIRAYLFTCRSIRHVTLFVKPPAPTDAKNTPIVVISVEQPEGPRRAIAWQNTSADETTARRLLSRYPEVTGAFCGADCGTVVLRDGTVQTIPDLLRLTAREAMEDAVAVPYAHQRRTSQI